MTRGTPHDGPCLITANHTSWLDIPIMGALQPSSFVAKSEVAGWPFFGWLAKLQQTVFVERERRTRTAEKRNEIHARIANGDKLILFPEGTSSDGNRVLPVVQPVSVAYMRLCGFPMGRRFRPYFAWYGDMDLFPHLWQAFSLGPIEIHVEYHKPVTIREIGNRKALAAYCESRCRAGVIAALTGRRADETPENEADHGAVAAPAAARVAG